MVENPSIHWERLVSATSPADRMNVFIDYCKDLLSWKERENKTPNEIAYFICSAIRFEDLNQNSIASELIELACDLEKPDGYLTYGNSEESLFKYMVKLINSLSNNKKF